MKWDFINTEVEEPEEKQDEKFLRIQQTRNINNNRQHRHTAADRECERTFVKTVNSKQRPNPPKLFMTNPQSVTNVYE